MKRPRGTPAQHAALARLFRQAFVELAERPVTPKKAAKKAARKAAKKTATKAAKKTAKSARKVAKR